MACSVCSLTYPGLPAEEENHQHQSLCRKMPNDLPTGQTNGGIFSVEVSSSRSTIVCIESNQHTPHLQDRIVRSDLLCLYPPSQPLFTHFFFYPMLLSRSELTRQVLWHLWDLIYSMPHCSDKKDKVTIFFWSLKSNVLEDKHRRAMKTAGEMQFNTRRPQI